MKRIQRILRWALLLSLGMTVIGPMAAQAADVVPTDIAMPGTQPGQVSNLESVDKCDNCHGGYSPSTEPAHNWRGSMMAQAGRDPLFWATVALAEQTVDGSGDLCLRCHAPAGWLAGRSTPTSGAALTAADAHGVDCDVCHKMTDPNNSEFPGVQTPPFLAHDEGSPPRGYYGSGQFVIFGGNEKLGPYTDAEARHQFAQTRFMRSADLCGTCHDVSNPLVGDLAHNNGAQIPLAPGSFSGVPGSPVGGKAAFNNFPHQYGAVERTFSEHKSSRLAQTRVADFATLPAELRDGAIRDAYDAAQLAGRGGDYEDGTSRLFSCQTCHMPPVVGQGCNKNPRVRPDLPLHDLTGGNYWAPDAIRYLDNLGRLRLGGGLTAGHLTALEDGKSRARKNLTRAAKLTVTGNTVRVVNLTGHKLISGYPEGRRMWLNMKWFDANGGLLREDGRYGSVNVTINGSATTVRSLTDLTGSNTRIYEAHGALTQQWATQLIALNLATPQLPLSFDRITGAVTYSLGDLAAQPPGTHYETFHFVLNNHVAKDNRIPPYGMRYDDARTRSILPVPASQYGAPGPGGNFAHWDDVVMTPPPGAVSARIDLLYQPTSWEYVQFLYLANRRQIPFLAAEGDNLLDAWLNTGMAEPQVMASATWGTSLTPGISGFWPGAGAAGTKVWVFGRNFVTGAGKTRVSVNGISAPLVQVVSSELLIFFLPAGDTTGPIVVTTDAGTASTSPLAFGTPPTPGALLVNGISPVAARAGQLVWVFGAGFDPAFGATRVQIGTTSVFAVQIIDPSLLVFVVPSSATSGSVSVTVGGQTATGATPLTILP